VRQAEGVLQQTGDRGVHVPHNGLYGGTTRFHSPAETFHQVDVAGEPVELVDKLLLVWSCSPFQPMNILPDLGQPGTHLDILPPYFRQPSFHRLHYPPSCVFIDPAATGFP
jgi:hypothetical protein